MITLNFPALIVKTFIITFLWCASTMAQPFQVGQKTYDFIDTERNRPVKTEIWYPTAELDKTQERATPLPFILKPTIRNAEKLENKYPLVILSHGTGGNRHGLAWLAITLAEQGYIVAAPDHWGNTFDNKIPEYFVRHWERPLDISFVLDKLLEDADISNHIDKDRIGVVGFSLGGYTALAMAGVEMDCERMKQNAQSNQYKSELNVPELGDLRKLIKELDCASSLSNLKDERVKLAVAIAPALGMGVDSIQKLDVPVLIVGIANDDRTPVATNAKHYHSIITDFKYFEIAGKAGHYVMLNQANDALKNEAKRYYMDDPSVNRSEVHSQVINVVFRLFDTSFENTKNNKDGKN